MKYDIDKNEYGFDTAISASDWKYSAAITGLIYYFKELEKEYEICQQIQFQKKFFQK